MIKKCVIGNPNNLELDVRISSGSAPTENINGSATATPGGGNVPRKAGLRAAMDRARVKL